MNLVCNAEDAVGLSSGRQRARRITEAWFAREGFCLNCTSSNLEATSAGTIARDFVCPVCAEPYELKASAQSHINLVQDGGFYAMMGRIAVQEAPTLMLLQYSPTWMVERLTAVSSVFFTPEVVRRRVKPHTRKSGASYLMCDLDLTVIPPDGKIVVVSGAALRPETQARAAFARSKRFADIPVEGRGWAGLVLSAVRAIGKQEFTLAEVYAHEAAMHAVYPENTHVRPKIRQQLQVLRDLGYLEFGERGEYKVLL